MSSFEDMNFTWIDFLIIFGIGVCIFVVLILIFPFLIRWLKKKEYIGYDIHKKDRPATAESGGIGISLGMVGGSILAIIAFPELWHEIFIFIITIIIATIIGWYDDRKALSSIKKIVLMILTGLPLFIANFYGIKFIDIPGPILPIIGELQITIIYPLLMPIIVTILTNTVNMLEGYNGEGSGTTSVALFFMILSAIILKSSEGLLLGIISFSAILAFYLFNKYPARAFPGDTGTLVIGAAIALIGTIGSLEFIMVLVMFPQIFNSFYVITSEKGFIESHSVKKKDIWMDKKEFIHASDERGAGITLPRLILVTGKLSEKDLVQHFIALSVISGLFALISTQLLRSRDNFDIILFILILVCSFTTYGYIIYKYRRIFMITIVMIVILLISLGLMLIIDAFIVETLLNWLYGGIVGIFILILWYSITIFYFWKTIEKQKLKPGYESLEMLKEKDEKSN